MDRQIQGLYGEFEQGLVSLWCVDCDFLWARGMRYDRDGEGGGRRVEKCGMHEAVFIT